MAVADDIKHHILKEGATKVVIDEAFTGSGVIKKYFAILTDVVVLGLFLRSNAGVVNVVVRTYDGEDETVYKEVMAIRNIKDSSTREIMLEKSSLCLSRIVLEITYTDDVDMRVMIKPSTDSDAAEDVAYREIEAENTELLADKKWKAVVGAYLSSIDDTLMRILNHNRKITSMEEEQGDKF